MSNETENKEILHLEAEEVITQEIALPDAKLQNYGTDDAKIAELKEKYLSLKINGVDDKEGYKACEDARKIVLPLATGVAKHEKLILEKVTKFTKEVKAESARVEAEVRIVLDHLKGEIKRIDDEKDRIKREEAEKREAAANARINSVISKGFVFDGTHYILPGSEYKISVVDIRNVSDELFNKEIAHADVEIQKVKEAKEKAEQEAREAKEKFEADQKKLKEDQQKLNDQKAELDRQAAALQKEKDDAEREKIASRTTPLKAMGFVHSPAEQRYIFSNEHGRHDVTEMQIKSMDAEQWKQAFTLAVGERSRIAKLKTDADAAAEIAAKEAKEKADKEAKELADKEAAKKEAERLEALPDIEKCNNFFSQITAIMNDNNILPKNNEIHTTFKNCCNQITQAIVHFTNKYTPKNEDQPERSEESN